MGYSSAREAYEAALSRAHIAIVRAETLAADLNSPGSEYDCHLIALEISRLADDSLSNKPRQVHKGQLKIDE
jgi:hypothetical protein